MALPLGINLDTIIIDLKEKYGDDVSNNIDIQELTETVVKGLLKATYKHSDEITHGTLDFMGRIADGMNMTEVANRVSVMSTAILENLDWDMVFGTLGNGFSKASGPFLQNLDVRRVSALVGNDLAVGVQNVMTPLNAAFEQSAGNLMQGLTYQLLPYVLLSSIAMVGTPLTLLHFYNKAKHNIGRPALALEERRTTTLSTLTNPIKSLWNRVRGDTEPKQIEPVYDEETTRAITRVSRSLINSQKHNGFLQNVLLYGPGGTGKTMIAKKMAQESNMDYIMMSGGSLAQFINRGEHVTELDKLMNSIKNGSRPTVLFIDEAEGLCMDRSKLKDDPKRLELVNAFLSHTGTNNKKMSVILATNRSQDIDPDIKNRMDQAIYVKPPGQAERFKILDLYATQLFTPQEKVVFDIKNIATSTEGMTGRTLFKLMNAIFTEKAISDDGILTRDMIDETVSMYIKQKQALNDYGSNQNVGQLVCDKSDLVNGEG